MKAVERFHIKLDAILPSLTTNTDFIDLENDLICVVQGTIQTCSKMCLSWLTAVQIIFQNKVPWDQKGWDFGSQKSLGSKMNLTGDRKKSSYCQD